ncbi:MAG: hypothetical protein ABL984_03120 [Pyrinomonadaceae bacterium]
MAKISPFTLLLWFLGGFVASVVYAALGMLLIWYFEGWSQSMAFVEAYMSSFKTVIALGLAIGTTLVLLKTQTTIQTAVEKAFRKEELKKTKYFEKQRDFWLPRKTILFAALIAGIGFVIFASSGFPLVGLGEKLMITAACIQYALGSFVGRKLMYTGMMLHSLTEIRVTRNLFTQRRLDEVNVFVMLLSTLTIIFVYVNVTTYFNGPFLFNGYFGKSLKLFLLFPAIIATPVLLIFNFYPREIVRRIYDRSIKVEMRNLRRTLHDETLTDYEKRVHLMEFQKLSREELRYRLQLTLSDLPFGITILIMVLQPLLK